MKEHKGQILAALALSMALGLAMPGAVFATEDVSEEVGEPVVTSLEAPEEVEIVELTDEEGTEDEVAPLANDAQTGAGANEGEDATDNEEEISQDVAENLVELNKRIQTRESFADYRKAVAMVKNATIVDAMTQKLEDLGTVASDFKWDDLTDEEKEAFQDKSLLEIVEMVKEDESYADNEMMQMLVTSVEEMMTELLANLRAEIKELLPETEGVDDMTTAQLVGTAKTYPNFAKYQKLAVAMTTLDDMSSKLATGVELTDVMVAVAYQNNEGEMMKSYNAIALAALEIDDTVMKGLMSYELPETSVSTPDTGAIDATDASALDLALVTLIVAGSLATLGGAALVAKLYLCHKF